MSLVHRDLHNTILPLISIDGFEPKAGNNDEVIVVALYAIDEEPAIDLNTFIQRGTVQVIDTEISPNPDENGRYLIFIEFERTKDFKDKFQQLITDIENLTGELSWKITVSGKDSALDVTDDDLYSIIDMGISPVDNIKGLLNNYFKESYLSTLTLESGYVIFNNCDTVKGEFISFGEVQSVIESNNLCETAIQLQNIDPVFYKLTQILGEGWTVSKLDNYAVISNDNSFNVLLIKDIQMVY